MKKILCIVLCLALGICCLGLVACDEAAPTPPDNGEDNTNGNNDGEKGDSLADINGNNVFVVTYKDNGNGSLTATVSVAGTVSYAGFTGTLKYDCNVMSVVSFNSENGTVVSDNSSGELAFSYGAVSNVTSVGSIFTVNFAYSGAIDTVLDLEVSEVANAALQDVEYSILDANVKIG